MLKLLLEHLISSLPGPGGDKRNRTADPLLAKQVLSQLSYTPISLGLKTLRALKIKQRLLAMISSDLTLDVKSLYFK